MLLLDEAGGTVGSSPTPTHRRLEPRRLAASPPGSVVRPESSSSPLTVLAIGAGVLLAGALGLRRMLVGSWPLRRVHRMPG